MAKDRARRETDKRLDQLEDDIGRMYATAPELVVVAKEYEKYMAEIWRKLRPKYLAYINAPAGQEETLKKAYTDEIRAYTFGSKQWRALVNKITGAMATVNERALDMINGEMSDVFIDNYNQVAVDCKEAGIQVNG